MNGSRVAIAAILCAIAFPALAVSAADGNADRGQIFAIRHCAACHAIGVTGESPYGAAPPFRILLQRSPVDYLTRTLRDGVAEDHRAFREMRGFVLSPTEAADLVAYWRRLEPEH
jgi:mono/diheme cytochrome c family protein